MIVSGVDLNAKLFLNFLCNFSRDAFTREYTSGGEAIAGLVERLGTKSHWREIINPLT